MMKSLRSLSIIIPAYNEEARLPDTLRKLDQFLSAASGMRVEILIVNDGSRDATSQVVQQAAQRDERYRLLENPGNHGKGYAVRNGMLAATGDWSLLTDADLSTPIDEVFTLHRAATAQGAEIAFGSRALDRSKVTVHQSWLRELSGRFFNVVMQAATGLPYQDTQCGFKLFSRRATRTVFPRQKLEGFGFDVEVLYIARLHGLPAVEVPVDWANVEGTKVSMLQGLNAFADIFRVRRNHWRGLYR